jgi:hypothetical protein
MGVEGVDGVDSGRTGIGGRAARRPPPFFSLEEAFCQCPARETARMPGSVSGH